MQSGVMKAVKTFVNVMNTVTRVVAITTHAHKVGSSHFTMKLQPQDVGENKVFVFSPCLGDEKTTQRCSTAHITRLLLTSCTFVKY